jgi:hypothetical protein
MLAAPLTGRRSSRSLRAVSASASLSGIFVQPAALLRLLCALLVALVTVTHTCGLDSGGMASARDVGPVAIVLDSGSDANDGRSSGDAGLTVEKCHFCSVVQLPATTLFVAQLSALHQVPAAITHDLLSFSPSATSPPPRTLT